MIRNKDLQLFLMSRYNTDTPDIILDQVEYLSISSGKDPILDDDLELSLNTCVTQSFGSKGDLMLFKHLKGLRISGQKLLLGTLLLPSSLEELFIFDCQNLTRVQIDNKTYDIQELPFGWTKSEGLLSTKKH